MSNLLGASYELPDLEVIREFLPLRLKGVYQRVCTQRLRAHINADSRFDSKNSIGWTAFALPAVSSRGS
jgi:hypothetical protein